MCLSLGKYKKLVCFLDVEKVIKVLCMLGCNNSLYGYVV